MDVHAKPAVLTPDGLDQLLGELAARGHRVLGPTLRDDAIVYDDISGIADLPQGWTDRQDAGRYRLERREDDALFGYAVGPQSWKKFLHPPMETLWRSRRTESGLAIDAPAPVAEKFAFIGVRACELHAIAIQDRVFLEGPYVDKAYGVRKLLDRLGLAPDQAVFFGDRLDEGGNDYPVIATGVPCVAVTGWQDTPAKVKATVPEAFPASQPLL